MAAAANMFGVRLRSWVTRLIHRPPPSTSSSARPLFFHSPAPSTHSHSVTSPGRTAHHLFNDAVHVSPLKSITTFRNQYVPKGLVSPSLRATMDNMVAESHSRPLTQLDDKHHLKHGSVLLDGMPAKLWMLVCGSPVVRSACTCDPEMPHVALMAMHKRNTQLTQELSDLGDDFNYCVVFIERQKDMISDLKRQLSEATGHPVMSNGRTASVGLGSLLA